jgi:hypothetical protein
MKLRDFKAWLDQFPDDAEVVIIEHEFKADVYVDFEYQDFTDHEWIAPTDTRYNKKYLILGVASE